MSITVISLFAMTVLQMEEVDKADGFEKVLWRVYSGRGEDVLKVVGFFLL